MEYITLANGIKMPLVGLGTWDLRGEECEKTVEDAIKLGYQLIDTAQMYENEEAVGNGIRKSGADRQNLFITTKIYRISRSYEQTKTALDESLLNLGLDYIDLVLLHEPYREGAEMYRALEEAYKEGKIRAVGISNYDEVLYPKFIEKCSVMPMVNQLEMHVLYQRQMFQEKLKKDNVAIQAWSPLSRGRGDVMTNTVLTEIGQKYEKTAAQIALKFLVQKGISVVPKTKHTNRLRENIDLFDFELSSEDMTLIGTLDKDETLFPWTKEFQKDAELLK